MKNPLTETESLLEGLIFGLDCPSAMVVKTYTDVREAFKAKTTIAKQLEVDSIYNNYIVPLERYLQNPKDIILIKLIRDRYQNSTKRQLYYNLYKLKQQHINAMLEHII